MKRKNISYRLCGVVAVVVAACCLWSCSKTEKTSGKDLTELAGADVSAVAIVRPAEILRSAGAVTENGRITLPASVSDGPLHADDRDLLTVLCGARGLDLDNMLVMSYVNPRMSAMVLGVTDSGALASSLGEAGWTGRHSEGGEVYCNDSSDDGVSLLCDGDLLWIVKDGEPDAVARTVEALKARATHPLPAWLTDALADTGNHVLNAAYASDSTRVFLASFGLEGPSMTAEVRCAAMADGAPRTFVDSDSAMTLGRAAAYINPDDLVSLGVALPRGFDMARLIQEFGYDIYVMPGVADAVRSLDGRVVLSAGMVDKSSADVMDLSNLRVSVALGTQPGQAARVLEALRGMQSSSYLPIDMRADGDLVLIGLNHGGSHDGMPEGAMGLLSADIPSDSPLLRMAGLPCGFTIKGDASNDGARLKITFTDSDKGFVATLLNILAIID